MSRLDDAETALQTASRKIEAAITAKRTELDTLRLRQRSLRQQADMLRARAARHEVAIPGELTDADTKLALDVSVDDVPARVR